MGIVSALALRIWRTNENARVAGKTLCFDCAFVSHGKLR